MIRLAILIIFLFCSYAHASPNVRGIPPDPPIGFIGKLINHGSPLLSGKGNFSEFKNWVYYDNGIGTRTGLTVYTSNGESNQTFKIIPFNQENDFYILAAQADTGGISLYQIEGGSFPSSTMYSTSGVTTTPVTCATIRNTLAVADSTGVSMWGGTSAYPTALLVENSDNIFTDRYEWIYDGDSHSVASGNTIWTGYSRPFDAWQLDKDASSWDSGVGVSSVTPQLRGGQWRYWASCYTTGTSTIDLPKIQTTFRPLDNFWAGNDWMYASSAIFIKTGSSEYQDYTGFVADESTETYMDISEMESGGSIVVGFRYPVREIRLYFPEENKNTEENITTGASYWNGASLVALASYVDGTAHNTAPFAETGSLTYDKPTDIEKRTFGNHPDALYYYWVGFDDAGSGVSIDNYVRIYKVVGIPDDDSPNDDNYTGVVAYQGKRLILYNGDNRDILKISAEFQPDVFNGSDTDEYSLGGRDRVVTAVPFNNGLMVFKESSGVYFFQGESVLTFEHQRLDDVPACEAPESAAVINHEGNPIIAYQASDGIYFLNSEGAYTQISEDIRSYWDTNNSLCIPDSWLDESVGVFDKKSYTYQLLVASGSGATQFTHELVYDIKRGKWSVFERNANALLSTFTAFTNEDNQSVILAGDYNGTVYRMNVGSGDSGYTINSDLTFNPVMLADRIGKNELRAMAIYYDLPSDISSLSGNTAYLTPSLSSTETTYQAGFSLNGTGFVYINLADWRSGSKGYTHTIRLRFPGQVYLFRKIIWSVPAPWAH